MRLSIFVFGLAAANAGEPPTEATTCQNNALVEQLGDTREAEGVVTSLLMTRVNRFAVAAADENAGAIVPEHHTLSTETGGEVFLRLSKPPLFFNASICSCRLASAPDGWNPPTTVSFVQGTCEMPQQVRCRLPPMAAEGPYSLQVRAGYRTEEVHLWYATPLAISLSQQPYFAATNAELLLRTNVTSPHGQLQLTAWGPKGLLLSEPVNAVGHATFPLSLAGLPAQLDTMLKVELLDSGTVVANRQARLVLVPDRLPGSAAVDFKRRALLVDGQPFFMISWFSTYLSFGLEAAIGSLQDVARRGANSVMMYNLISKKNVFFEDREPPLPGAFLDAAATVGVKVHVYLLDIVMPLAKGTGTDWGPLERVVRDWRDHPAVLSWYVADDDAGPNLPEVYDRIKALDPHHLVVIAINNPGNAHLEKYRQGADVIMLETYSTTADGPFTTMGVLNRWPTEFLPAVTCGRAWSEGDTGGISDAVISPQMFRSQVYNALAAGATGEIWFAYRNADGWNEPGIPLQDAAGTVARELLDLVPSLLSTGNYNNATAMPPVAATAFLQDGRAAPSYALRARAFREASGCVNLLLVSGLNEPIHALVNFRLGSPGVYSVGTEEVTALVPFEKASPPRRVLVRNGSLSEWLPSLGVQVFRFSGASDCAEPYLAQADCGNLLLNPSFERSSTYISAPDGWECSMAPPPQGLRDSSCFADTHDAVHGRHSGRFVTGNNPFLFRVRPTYTLRWSGSGKCEGSVWAKAMVPMELLAMVEHHGQREVEIARSALNSTWQHFHFGGDLSSEKKLIFKASRPGVFWLDQAELHLMRP